MRRRALLPAVALALAAGEAGAVGGFGADPPATTIASSVRAAVQDDGSRKTIWIGATLEGAADRVVWVVPVQPGVTVDRASTAVFDALEEATAPRIVAANACGADAPEHVVLSPGDAPARTPDVDAKVFSDAAGLSAELAALGVEEGVLSSGDLAAAFLGGGRALLVVMTPEPGTHATPTLRLTGGAATLPLAVFRADGTTDVPGTLWALGPSRATFGTFATVPSGKVTLDGGATNYGALRDALLADGRLVLESASRSTLSRSYVFPGGQVPSVADAFLVRAFAKGELPIDLGAASDAAHQAAVKGGSALPCGAGALVAGTCSSSDPLAGALGAGSDLSFLLAGDAPTRTVTRYAFRVPKGGKLDLPMPAFADADDVSPLRFVPGGCPAMGTGAAGATSSGGGHSTPAGDPTSERSEESGDDGTSPSVGVDVGCSGEGDGSSCSGDSSGSSDSCSSDSSGGGGDSCSGESSGGGGGDSCSKDSGGGDSCSGDSGGGDSCSSSEGGGGDSCSGGGGGEGGGGCNCEVPARGRHKPARWLVPVLALLLPLRRWTRPNGKAGPRTH